MRSTTKKTMTMRSATVAGAALLAFAAIGCETDSNDTPPATDVEDQPVGPDPGDDELNDPDMDDQTNDPEMDDDTDDDVG